MNCRSRIRTACALQQRRGITLFEVVLALAIFVGSLAALGQVLRTGSRASIRAELLSEAALRCESRMSDVLSGVVPLESVSATPFEDGSPWAWSLAIFDTGTPNLLRLELTVNYNGPGGDGRTEFQLVRLLRDPIVFQSTGTVGEASL